MRGRAFENIESARFSMRRKNSPLRVNDPATESPLVCSETMPSPRVVTTNGSWGGKLPR